MDPKIICTACGTQFPLHVRPERCPICVDDRQYVPEAGQTWTDLQSLTGSHAVTTHAINDRLHELVVTPSFAIGQRALLVTTDAGNILWDCIALLNKQTIEFIMSKGGLKAIAFSHPHYYTTMNEWADSFDCPIYIHQNDEQWIVNKGSHVTLWSGSEKALWDGMKLINVGGHFAGSSILHVPFLSLNGTVLCGDTFYISPSKKFMSVMYSYVNRVPLSVREVQRIQKQMSSLQFDTMHGFLRYQNIHGDAKEVLMNSFGKYI